MKWTSEELTFIDGDGSINKKTSNSAGIGIRIHTSWYDFLIKLNEKVYRLCGLKDPTTQVAMSKTRELVVLTWGRQDIRKMFLEVITDNGLPVMKRKWIKLPEMGNESLSKEVYPELWV